jgi:bifunctional non-homologous end joining protein LigD
LVCEIKYTEITTDGKMRHPIFLRLREDKKANEITMENVKEIKIKKSTQTAASEKINTAETSKIKKTISEEKVKAKNTKTKANEVPEKENTISFGKTKVNVTNLNKVFWPEEGITKGDVINYYISISKYILPYLKGRPESLKRNPNGIHDKGFFHKDAGNEAPEWVESLPIFSDSANKKIDYIICNNQPTLTYLNNLGCIELNPWHSTVEALDNPDYMIIDIDPSENNTFDQVIETANVFHNLFEKAGAASYCKTSGATGLHIYVPTAKKYSYDQLKNFAHLICIMAQHQLPEFTSLERNLQKRGNKMIYLDHLQNRRGQTISSVYSLRPKEGATVSMPLEWKEVKKGLSPSQFTIHNALKRIEKKGDIFSAILGKGIDLQKCLSLLEKKE